MVLGEVAGGAGPQHTDSKLVLVAHAKHQDGRLCASWPVLTNQIENLGRRHGDIAKQQHVGLGSPCSVEKAATLGGWFDEPHIGALRDNMLQPFAEHGAIVRD